MGSLSKNGGVGRFRWCCNLVAGLDWTWIVRGDRKIKLNRFRNGMNEMKINEKCKIVERKRDEKRALFFFRFFTPTPIPVP